MTKKPSPYIGFIDLLGTKESSSVSENHFHKAILAFAKELHGNSKCLTSNDKVHIFSDCAFFQISDFERLYKYIDSIRGSLFSQGYYFKSAISHGSLALSEPALSLNAKDTPAKITVNVFGRDTVKVYLSHEKFKGIGSIVEINKCDDYRHLLVDSVFLPIENRSHYRVFKDFRFGHPFVGLVCDGISNFYSLYGDDQDRGLDLGEEVIIEANAVRFLECFLQNFVRSKIKSKRYGRYYISTLFSLIQSSDFSKLYLDQSGEWKNFPYIFWILYGMNFLDKNLSDVIGIEVIYLKLIENIFCSKALVGDVEEIAKDEIVLFLSRRKKTIEAMASMPEQVIKPTIREEVLDRISAHTIKAGRRQQAC